MSTIKVDTIATRTGSGNITASNTIAGTSATLSGTLGVTGDLTVDTNTLKVDSSNNRVGIGTASPSQDLTIVNSGSARMELISGTSGTSIIDMGDSADSDIGGIRYLQSSDRLQFRAGNDVRVSIDSNGLKFGSDTAAANALDDYEEGTWTPNIGGSGVGYGTQGGVYRKIGNLVYVYLQISINTYGSPATSNEIFGLPFTPATSNQYFGVAYYNGINTNTYELHGNFRTNDRIRIEGKGSFGTGQSSGLSWAGNGASIYGSGCYYTS